MKNDRVNLQHRPFLTPIWLVAAGAAMAVGFAIFVVWVWASADSTTVVVVSDPSSSAGAQARSALLTRIFSAASGPGSLDAVYVSAGSAAASTAAPLAAGLGLVPTVVPGGDVKALGRRALREHGGGRALVIGPVDSVPAIVASLAGRDDIPKIDERSYGVMYVVTVPRIGHANVLRLSY
jgi:hypothetical protein